VNSINLVGTRDISEIRGSEVINVDPSSTATAIMYASTSESFPLCLHFSSDAQMALGDGL
jgi:hypothetical protein